MATLQDHPSGDGSSSTDAASKRNTVAYTGLSRRRFQSKLQRASTFANTAPSTTTYRPYTTTTATAAIANASATPARLIPITGDRPIDSLARLPASMGSSSPAASPTSPSSVQQVRTGVNTEGDLPHYVLIPIGKTGDGKSSLLNAMFGYKEFTANASYRSVTDAVLERTGVWTVKGKNTIVTVADTPGFADSAKRDFTAEIQDYIFDVSNRIGIDAFLLVCSFKTKIPVVKDILKQFAELMKDMEPADWRKHVVLVFTKVDYKSKDMNETTNHKNYLVNQFSKEMMDIFGLDESLPVAFVSNQLPECGITKGKKCDCAPYKEYYFSKMYALQAKIEDCAKNGRWRAKRPPPRPPAPVHAHPEPQQQLPPPVPPHHGPRDAPFDHIPFGAPPLQHPAALDKSLPPLPPIHQ